MTDPDTRGDAQRRGLIKTRGIEALIRIKNNQTYEDWRMIGQALMVITEETLAAMGLAEWDQNNNKLKKEFSRRFEVWEVTAGDNRKPLTKQERWALRQIMTVPAYHDFYMTLTGPEQRKTNYPNAIIKKYKAKQTPRTPRAPEKEMLKIELDQKNAHIAELEAARDDGDTYKVTDSPKDIAVQIVGRFQAYPGKARKIANAILALLDKRKKEEAADEAA